MKPVLSILTVVAVLTGLAAPAAAQAQSPYVLGAVLSLSGPVAANGVPTKDGIQVAVEEITAVGGIDGHPIEVLFEDDQSKPDQAVILANKLITQNRALMILGASFGSTTDAISTVAEKQKVPHLSPTAWTKKDLVEVPLSSLSPLNAHGLEAEVVVREYCCPGCGLLPVVPAK